MRGRVGRLVGSPRGLGFAVAVLACLLGFAAAAPALTRMEARGFRAIQDGNRANFERALQEGFSARDEDDDGVPAIVYAVRYDRPEMLERLIDEGADVDYRADDDTTLLHLAARRNSDEVVPVLVEAGLDVDATGYTQKSGRKTKVTALSLAAHRGHLKTVKALFEAGADVNHVDALNGTPLARAKAKDHDDVVRYLESVGAVETADEAEDAEEDEDEADDDADEPDDADSEDDDDDDSGSDVAERVRQAAGETEPEDDDSLATRGAGGFGGLMTGEAEEPPLPEAPAPSRRIVEIRPETVYGSGELAFLWTEYRNRNPELQLDENGHSNALVGVVKTGGSQSSVLDVGAAAELYQIAQEQGYVVSNPEAPFLVAPMGGVAQVQTEEHNRINQGYDALSRAVTERQERAEARKQAAEEAAREEAEREEAEREKAEREKADREKAEREKAEREKAEREKAEEEASDDDQEEPEPDLTERPLADRIRDAVASGATSDESSSGGGGFSIGSSQ